MFAQYLFCDASSLAESILIDLAVKKAPMPLMPFMHICIFTACASFVSDHIGMLEYLPTMYLQFLLQGDLVVQVKAKDRDELNHAIMYSLSGEGSDLFHIHEATGEVTVRNTLLLAIGQNYLLQATVSGPILSARN